MKSACHSELHSAQRRPLTQQLYDCNFNGHDSTSVRGAAAEALVESAWDIVKVMACGNKSNHVAAFQANDNNRMSNKSYF